MAVTCGYQSIERYAIKLHGFTKRMEAALQITTWSQCELGMPLFGRGRVEIIRLGALIGAIWNTHLWFGCRLADKARSLKRYYQYRFKFKVQLNELIDDYFHLHKTFTLGLFCVSCRSIRKRTRVAERLRLFLSLSTFAQKTDSIKNFISNFISH